MKDEDQEPKKVPRNDSQSLVDRIKRPVPLKKPLLASEPSLNIGAVDSDQMKLYSLLQVLFATLVGGPFAGCYLMHTNFKQLGHDYYARRTLFWGIVGSLILIGTNLVLNLHLFVVLIMWFWYQRLQRENYRHFLTQGAQRNSWWLAVGIGFLVLLGTIQLQLLYVEILLALGWV